MPIARISNPSQGSTTELPPIPGRNEKHHVDGSARKEIWRLLMVLTMMWLAAGCSRHILSESALTAVDMPGGYEEINKSPRSHIGKTIILGGYISEIIITREGTILKIQPYSVDKRGVPRRLIQGGAEFLARTDRLLTPDKFGAGHMVTLTGTYMGLEPAGHDGEDYRRLLFQIVDIRPLPPPAHYPYGYRYPYRIY